MPAVAEEFTQNPRVFYTKNGSHGAQGLMQLRSGTIAQIVENRVKAKWTAKGKPENKLNAKELEQLCAEIKTAKKTHVAKIMNEGLKLKEGTPKGSSNIKDYEAIPNTGLFNTDTNLQYGVEYLKYQVKKKGSLEKGIKGYHGNKKDTENQNYYNMVKVLIDAKKNTQKL